MCVVNILSSSCKLCFFQIKARASELFGVLQQVLQLSDETTSPSSRAGFSKKTATMSETQSHLELANRKFALMPSNFQLWANAMTNGCAPHHQPQQDERSNRTMMRYCDNVYNLSGVNYRRRDGAPMKNISASSLIHNMMPWKRKLLGLKPTVGVISVVEEEESSSSADDVRSRTCCHWYWRLWHKRGYGGRKPA